MSLEALKRLYAEPRMGESIQREPEQEHFKAPTLVIRNSFCTLYSIPPDALRGIEEALTYKNEAVAQQKIQCFRLLAMAKVQGKTGLIYKLKRTLDELDQQEIVCWLRNGQFPTGHLAIVRGILAEHGVSFAEEDRRKVPQLRWTLNWKNPQHPLRYYQEEMATIATNGENPRGVFVAAVGTGKSRVLAEILKRLGVTSLVVVPSTALLEQVYRGLDNAFGSKYVEKISTQKIKSGLAKKKGLRLRPIRIVTIQTLAALQKVKLLRPLIEDIDLIAVDEIHHAGSKSYTALLPELEHVYYRFGFTGTFTRNDCKILDMWGFLSNVLYELPAWKATQEGFLTPVEFFVHTLPGRRCGQYQQEYNKNYCGSPTLLEEIQNIFQRYVTQDEQVLILVDRKDAAGLVIHEMLNELGVENTYISGDDKKDVVSGAIIGFNKKEIKVLLGSTIIGEGVDVFATDRLILARGGKSEIAIPQAIGRAIRLAPGKCKAHVHDFRFTGTKYMERHLDLRLELYRETFGGQIQEVAA